MKMTDRIESDALAQLIQAGGRRQDPPPYAYEQTLAVARAAWQAKVGRRQRRMMAMLAATLAAVVAGAWVLLTPSSGPPQQIAFVERTIGIVEMRANDSATWRTLRDETSLLVQGEMLRTREGSRAGLLLADTISLRLAENTEVGLEPDSRIRLLRGQIYLDTPGDGQRVQVITAAGVASDIGTQFEIQYRGDLYRLRVRTGAVLLQRGRDELRGEAGEQLVVDAAGRMQKTPVAPDDPDWDWVQSLAPAPDIDNQPLTVLLDWVARETGWAVEFSSEEIERKAARTILHGNIRHLTPLEALTVMLATTDLQHVVLDSGKIRIQPRSGSLDSRL